ncbi:hypothetical protein BT93_K1922 [Corymbia citriodora subsp. variegata]|nr:hypothetical protein BT93_K1922 [Corymbia citriodora subsp. variegata]
MGRKKLVVKKIEKPSGRLATYRKRKDGIVKKAAELSGLCDTDVGLIMFSPNGRLTSFASSSDSVKDAFLRYLNLPDISRGELVENKEVLRQGLVHVKREAQMLEALTKKQALEEELAVLNQQQAEVQQKIRSYSPNPEEIRSVQEIEVHIRFLSDAIGRIEHMKQAKLSRNQLLPRGSASFEVPAALASGSNLATSSSAYSIQKRDRSDDERRGEAVQHLSIGPSKPPQAKQNV